MVLLASSTWDLNNIKLFSDSRAAIVQALNSNIITSQLVKDTVGALNRIGGQVRRMEIAWIKAHVGHPGNERVDKLARQAANFPSIEKGVSPTAQLLEVIYKLWTDKWLTQKTCRPLKNFLPFPCKNESKEILRLSRSQIRRLLELITGQNNLNYVQNKIYPGQISELCMFCEEEAETFAHIINECLCFITARREILNNIPIINSGKWKAKTLLKFSYIEAIDEALTMN